MELAAYKALESSKIQPLLGGLAAVASAGLFSFDAASAPFFLLAVLAVPASYAFWLGVDNYVLTQVDAKTLGVETHRAGLIRGAKRCQNWMVAYAVLSIASIAIGAYAHFGTLQTKVSVDLGFFIVFGIAFAAVAHAVLSIRERRQLREKVIEEGRALSDSESAAGG
ncbi:MAG: hypothetical protein ACFE0P_12950 [Oceanicaulis sp.]